MEHRNARTHYLLRAVNRPAVEPPAFVNCVLDLQACFDMLHRRGYKADTEASHDASYAMTDSRKLVGWLFTSSPSDPIR